MYLYFFTIQYKGYNNAVNIWSGIKTLVKQVLLCVAQHNWYTLILPLLCKMEWTTYCDEQKNGDVLISLFEYGTLKVFVSNQKCDTFC